LIVIRQQGWPTAHANGNVLTSPQLFSHRSVIVTAMTSLASLANNVTGAVLISFSLVSISVLNSHLIGKYLEKVIDNLVNGKQIRNIPKQFKLNSETKTQCGPHSTRYSTVQYSTVHSTQYSYLMACFSRRHSCDISFFMWKMLLLDSTSKRQSKKRLFYFTLKFLIYDRDYKN